MEAGSVNVPPSWGRKYPSASPPSRRGSYLRACPPFSGRQKYIGTLPLEGLAQPEYEKVRRKTTAHRVRTNQDLCAYVCAAYDDYSKGPCLRE